MRNQKIRLAIILGIFNLLILSGCLGDRNTNRLSSPAHSPNSTPVTHSPADNDPPKWIDIAMGNSFVPFEPNSSRVPNYFLAALDSKGVVYLKGAVEPFGQILPSGHKTLEDFSVYGLVMKFVKADVDLKLTAVFKSWGSFFARVSDREMLHLPSEQTIAGKFRSISSSDESGNKKAFLIDEEGKLWLYDIESKSLGKISVLNAQSFEYAEQYNRGLLLIDSNGLFSMWQTEDGKTGNILSGPPLPNNEKLKLVTAFSSSFFGIGENGRLYHWGYELPNNTGRIEMGAIRQIGTESNWQFITSGGRQGYVCLINTNGEAFAFGHNRDGILGTSKSEEFIPEPTKIETEVRFSKVISSNDAFYGLSIEGKLYAWGNNYYPWDKKRLGTLGVGVADRVVNKPKLVIE